MPTLHHLALRTPELERLEEFYVTVLGLRVLRRDRARGSVWLGVGSVVLMLERAAPGEPQVSAGSLDLIAFAAEHADDARGALASWRARLEDAGVAVEGATEHTLYFRDPDGRRVGVSAFRWPDFG
jgi:catechol-2,3-dioxygenase